MQNSPRRRGQASSLSVTEPAFGSSPLGSPQLSSAATTPQQHPSPRFRPNLFSSDKAMHRYSRVPNKDTTGEKEKGTEGKSLRYQSANKNEVPWDAVRLSVGLLLAGLILLVLGGLHLSRHIVGKDGAGWGLVVLGCLTLVPGFYMSRILYYSWRGRLGFSFDDIPRVR